MEEFVYIIILKKKYRIWWNEFTLNIPEDHTKDYSGEPDTTIEDSTGMIKSFESDDLQDILDKIETEQLNILGEHVDYNQDI